MATPITLMRKIPPFRGHRSKVPHSAKPSTALSPTIYGLQLLAIENSPVSLVVAAYPSNADFLSLVQDCSFCVDDFVYIKANEQEDPDPNAPIQGWVGKVLEVRAGNESHVYLRIYWMYRPEDLPGGRQPYHAKKELIASNDMMVIDAQAVDGKASVAHWVEDKDLTVLSEHQLLWRQTFDIRSPRKVLSELPKHCIDQKPCNPDELLIQCDSCEKWLHGPCLEQEAVRGAYKTHNIPFPGEEVAVTTSQNTPNSSKRRAKSAASPADSSTPAKRRRPRKSDILKEQSLEPSNLLFSAELQVKDGESVVMMVTDQRPGQKKKKSQVPVNCLLCGELIEGKSTEQSEDAEPTATSSSSILVTNPVTPKNKEEEEEEDSVLGDTDSERQAKQHISPTTLGINGAPSAPSAPSDEASSFNRADTGDGSDSTALERAEKTEEPHTSETFNDTCIPRYKNLIIF